MVTIVDPHIKRDPAWRLFKEAEDKGLYVKNKDGADFDGCAAAVPLVLWKAALRGRPGRQGRAARAAPCQACAGQPHRAAPRRALNPPRLCPAPRYAQLVLARLLILPGHDLTRGA